MKCLLIFLSILSLFRYHAGDEINTSSFPDDFLFGTATNAYQVEGAWNVSGKGENIWDHATHIDPSFIYDGHNADVASDAYHHVEEDIQILKDIGVDYYRFSISWSRLLPTGFPNVINEDGIRFYNQILDLLKENNIKAFVTIYNLDLPQPLQDWGGWLNPWIIDWYLDYARVVFDLFADRVDTWYTFSEPYQICREGYGTGEKAPRINLTGIGDYVCGHNLLKAHAKAYHMFNNTYRSVNNASISFVIHVPWTVPLTSNEEDVEAASRLMQFYAGWWAHPIFTDEGNYPQVMIDIVGNRSELEGFSCSRLPAFTYEEIEELKGTADFFALNHFTSVVVQYTPFNISTPSFTKDISLAYGFDDSWPVEEPSILRFVPFGIKNALLFVKDQYNNPDIHIMENGFADGGLINDTGRINFLKEYLSAVLDAMDEGASVKQYTMWSFIDTFELNAGFLEKYGFIQIDFNSPNRTRTYKASVDYYKYIMKNRILTGYD